MKTARFKAESRKYNPIENIIMCKLTPVIIEEGKHEGIILKMTLFEAVPQFADCFY